MTTFFFGTSGGCLDAFYLYRENFPNDDQLQFLSDNHKPGDNFLNFEVKGSFKLINDSEFKSSHFVYQCGSVKNHFDRNLWFERAVKNGMIPVTIISRLAYVHHTASIGEGSIIYPGVKIMANVKIGKNCIILPNSVINHDTVVGDFSLINSLCTINGSVNISCNSYIGSMSSIKEGVFIAPKTTIGMSSVVLSDLIETGLYYGSPAKRK